MGYQKEVISKGKIRFKVGNIWVYEDNSILEFDKLWDLLMPVVYKIQRLGYRINIDFGDSVQYAISNIDPMMEIVEYSLYDAIIEFIKWYNQSKK